MENIIHLEPRFAIECHEAELIDDGVVRYRVGLAAEGVLFRADGPWQSSKAFLEGDITHNEISATVDVVVLARPSELNEQVAVQILTAAFDAIDQGGAYEDGCVTVLPIDLGAWLRSRLHFDAAVQAENALRKAVMVNNAILEN